MVTEAFTTGRGGLYHWSWRHLPLVVEAFTTGRGGLYHWSWRTLLLVQGGILQWSRPGAASLVTSPATTEEFFLLDWSRRAGDQTNVWSSLCRHLSFLDEVRTCRSWLFSTQPADRGLYYYWPLRLLSTYERNPRRKDRTGHRRRRLAGLGADHVEGPAADSRQPGLRGGPRRASESYRAWAATY